MTVDPETELMKRVALGDRTAFEELVGRAKGLVAGVVYRFLGHARETEDLAQEVWIRVWNARATWKPSARFSTWIGTIAARICLNEREKLARRKTVGLEEVPAPEAMGLAGDEARRVRQAVLELPPDQRMAVVLRYFGGQSDRETAEALGVSLSAAQSLLYRARQKLVVVLEGEFRPPE